jgi:uncharacterized protein YfaT (DUF1175 family)/uncharacterized protein YfaP (DUF2135 family)
MAPTSTYPNRDIPLGKLTCTKVLFTVLGGAISFLVCSLPAWSAPTTNPEVVQRRGKLLGGTGEEKPVLTLNEPKGGWTSSQMIAISGQCSDPTADPIVAAINGVRYFIRVQDGAFSRKFPASRGENSVRVECSNKAGTASETRTITGVMSPVRLKVVLTSDTDGVYTDLHLYEPDGHHVYWAATNSPSGGLFYLNQQGESFDQPGYGPYLFVHPAPPLGVFRIDTNYWPGGAVQHTLANLDIVADEGMPQEFRKRVRKPLARPGETQTLAYVVVQQNGKPMKVFVPGQDDPKEMPLEVREYQKSIEPKIAQQNEGGGEEYAYLPPREDKVVRDAVVRVALSQSKRANANWNPEQRDCAGLVRYSYREALSPRTPEQEKFYPKGVHIPALSFHPKRVLPSFPELWMTGFQKDGGVKHNSFADAETLLSYNFRNKGRSLELAKAGDLLAFRREADTGEQYHLMIFAGPDVARGVVVYHTGSEPESVPRREGYFIPKGEHQVRVISALSLNNSPDPIWKPIQENPYFLGVFEWKHFNPRAEDARFAQSL